MRGPAIGSIWVARERNNVVRFIRVVSVEDGGAYCGVVNIHPDGTEMRRPRRRSVAVEPGLGGAPGRPRGYGWVARADAAREEPSPTQSSRSEPVLSAGCRTAPTPLPHLLQELEDAVMYASQVYEEDGSPSGDGPEQLAILEATVALAARVRKLRQKRLGGL